MGRFAFTAFVLLVLISITSWSVADSDESENKSVVKKSGENSQEIGTRPNAYEGFIFGELRGVREYLSEYGISLGIDYAAEIMGKVHGGISETNGSSYRGGSNVSLELDTEAGNFWNGGTFFFNYMNIHGRSIGAEYVGDFQTLSNLDAENFQQVSELWYRHSFADDKIWVKIGKQESTEDFAAPEYGGEFIHASPGIHPTIPIVTFPSTDWGVVVGTEITSSVFLTAGALHGPGTCLENPYGLLFLIEPTLSYSVADREGKLRVGYWRSEAGFDTITDSEDHEDLFGISGLYITMEQVLWREEPESEDDEQGIFFFFQFGDSPPSCFEARSYQGGGVQWTGCIPGRDDDAIGLGVFTINFSDVFKSPERYETAIELFYKYKLIDGFHVKADAQYINNPSGLADRDAFVMGTRLELSF